MAALLELPKVPFRGGRPAGVVEGFVSQIGGSPAGVVEGAWENEELFPFLRFGVLGDFNEVDCLVLKLGAMSVVACE